MTTRLSFDDFFTGLLAGLASRGTRSISIRGATFDRTVERVAQLLQQQAGSSVDLRFHLQPHYIHGYSTVVRDAIAAATQDDLISLDNPEYQDMRFKISREEAEDILGDLPLSPDTFRSLADQFLRAYDEMKAPAA